MLASSHFTLLDTFLYQHRAFWQFSPFDCLTLPWQASQPELCDWLSSQSLQSLESYKAQPIELATFLSKWLPALDGYSLLCQLPLANKAFIDGCQRLEQGIPGRKLLQLHEFNAALSFKHKKDHLWLEWCSGKGYLGRVLSASRKAKVISLEWQESLCQEGQAFADKHQLAMQFIHSDAFAASSELWVAKCRHAVALHACGDLHCHLLQLTTKHSLSSIAISPCCYHLIKAKTYQPLSKLAQQSHLQLSRQSLKLPLQETVTAGQRVRQMRIKEVSYRLGFDEMQRQLFNKRSYLPVPNIQKSMLSQGFEHFCHWAAQQKGLVLPCNIDFAQFEQQGLARFELVERMEMVRTCFRRPLELWLALDKVNFLQEQGYQVSLTEFCEKRLTPRNLLITASKS